MPNSSANIGHPFKRQGLFHSCLEVIRKAADFIDSNYDRSFLVAKKY